MKSKTFLTFSLQGLLLAVETGRVREIIWLPELTRIEECPSSIAGVVNMHGTVVPVVDLNIRFGHQSAGYGCSDRVIILEVSGCGNSGSGAGRGGNGITDTVSSLSPLKLLGIIVNEVLDVTAIPEGKIELPPFAERETALHPHFVGGVAKSGQEIIMILDLDALLDYGFEPTASAIGQAENHAFTAGNYFSPGADPAEQELFHTRAMSLQKLPDADDTNEATPVAVISLNDEYLCVELASVLEFSGIHDFTPVPCCPPHIAGNMNLRGNVLTVLDITGLLNMPANRMSDSSKVIVLDTGEFSVGVIVDEILDIISLRAMDIVPVSPSMKGHDDRFSRGVAPYAGRMMSLLDLKSILSWDGLIVNEEA